MKITPKKTELPILFRSPAVFAKRYWWAVALLLIAASFDAWTTYVNLKLYGTGIEVHPVQRIVFDTFGIAAGVPIAKVLQLAFVVFVAAWWKPWCRWVLLLCAVLYGFAALSNHNLWL